MSVDAGKLSFSSQFRYERIALKASVPISITTAEFIKIFTVPHGLTYPPYVKGFYTFDNATYFTLFAGPNSYNLAGNMVQVDSYYVDSTNLYVQMTNYGVSTVTGRLYYRIYAEPQV